MTNRPPSRQELDHTILLQEIYGLIDALQEKSGHVSEMLRMLDEKFIKLLRAEKEIRHEMTP